MYIKLIFKYTINNKQMYTLLDCTKAEISTVYTFGSVNFTHTLLVKTHTHDVSVPWLKNI